jgi:hypothetical protein
MCCVEIIASGCELVFDYVAQLGEVVQAFA